MDFKATLVSSNDDRHKCSYLKYRTKYCIFLPLICTTVADLISPSLLTDMSLGWSLPPSVLLTGA